MKKIILIIGVLVSLTAAHIVFGQVTEGVIHYETKINMHRNIPPEREGMKNMIPEFRTMKNQLYFNAAETIYKPVIEDEEEDINTGGMRFRMAMPQSETYINTESQLRTVSQEFMGKKYLIEDTLKMLPWKFGTETKTILGYVCKQAYFTEETQVMTMGGPGSTQAQTRTAEITAWYTDQILPFLGPERFNTLPGTVLAVDINGGERVILATKIEPRTLKKNELKIPSTGTKVSQEEYRKMVAEQMDKMRQGGGNMIIRN
jgi:GLPGLI family protein